jgi:hypothetical protein
VDSSYSDIVCACELPASNGLTHTMYVTHAIHYTVDALML